VDWPLHENDLDEPGIIDPMIMHRNRTVHPVAVLCFFNELLNEMADDGTLTPIYRLRSEIGHNPVYELVVPGGTVSVVHPGVGAPLAAGVLEEMRGLGVTTFVACGGAGALRDELALGHVMIVESALRDEGTSFHYAAPSRVIDADRLGVEVLESVLHARDVKHFTGRAWTTDAFFRETRSRIARRLDEGCSMVDMESAAFIAVARYHGLRVAQLLYAGDSVAGDNWDSRHWDKATNMRRRLFLLAADAAWALHQR
jgi:uridine phosphorylase